MAAIALDDRGIVVLCPACGQKNRLAYERLGHLVRCGACKRELTAPAVPLDIHTATEFDRLASRASIPLAVDFWAPWCGPCKMVAPELVKVAVRQAGQTLVVKINTDAVPELGQRFGIRSIPTLAVFAGGREVARTTGARPAADIEAFLAQAVDAVLTRRTPPDSK